MAGIKVPTPCGELEIPLPSFPFPALPDLPSFAFKLPKLSLPMPDCDVVKQAIGATGEPEEDSRG